MRSYKLRVTAFAVAAAGLATGGVVFGPARFGGGLDLAPVVTLTLMSQVFAFDTVEFWSSFAPLFAIMNPLVAVPMFVRVTQRRDAGARLRLASVTSLTVLLALIAAALFGQQLLDFFAISIGSFRVAGGVIVLLMGLAMLHADSGSRDAYAPGHDTGTDEEESQAICPIAIPLLAGPGAIATMIVQSRSADTVTDYGLIACVISAMVALTFLALRSAVPIVRSLGPTGLMVVTRLIGMIVAAIAIDMMVIGLRLSFPGML